MNKKQMKRCYKDLSDLFSNTNDADEMNAIIKVKDLLINKIKYRDTFEKAFKKHTPTNVGKKISKIGGKNGNYNNKNRKEKNIQRL